MKRCSRCGKTKSDSEFYEYKDRRNLKKVKIRLNCYCKECVNAKRRALYQKYYNRHREYREGYVKRQKRIIRGKIGSTCVLCGSKEHIHYHEIHFKKHTYTYHYIATHTEDFIPMCFNCHNVLHKALRIKNWKKFFELLKRGKEN